WNRIPVAKFEESLKKEIILNKFINIISAGVVVTEEEIWQNYKTENESAKLEFAVLEIDKIELDKEPSLAEIKQYFEKNKSKFHIPEKREGIIVFLKTDELQPEIKLAEAEIEKYYNDNLSQFKEPEKIQVSRIYLPFQGKEKDLVRAEAKNILKKIKTGQDFSSLAEKYSKDEKAKEGGDWGFFDWRKLSSEEQQKINSMAAGETSGLIELKDGISILRVSQKTPSKTKPLDEVRDKIETILREKKARDLAEKRISNLEKRAKKEKSLDVAAQKLGLKIRKTGLLKEGQAIEDIDPSGSISQSLFQLKEQQISALIYTYKGVGVVQLKKIVPPHAASFDEVKDEVKKQLIDHKKKQKALETMKKVKAELKSKSLEILAEQYGLDYKTAEEHKRGQYLSVVGENPEVDRLAFSLPIGKASQPVELENGFVLLRVLSRKEVTREDFEKNKEEERKKLLEAKRNKFLQSYLYKLRNEMGVKIRYDVFLKINSDIMARFESE
ncbi:MAG: peptidyl-prolyl cis-trans isomerase, partial [Candidatus Aminicenantales bacterium]